MSDLTPWGNNESPHPIMSEDSDWYAFPKTLTKREVVSEMVFNWVDWWLDENTWLDDDDKVHGWVSALRTMFESVEASALRPAREGEDGFEYDYWYEDAEGPVEAWVVRL